jgi:UDP-glucose 4-epimerase
MRVFLTGGTGYIGAVLAKQLVERGIPSMPWRATGTGEPCSNGSGHGSSLATSSMRLSWKRG